MELNQFDLYSSISQSELKNLDDEKAILQKVEKLRFFDTASEVKDWLREMWGIKDDILNFSLAKNVSLSTASGDKYFNVTLQMENKIKTYNYTKENSYD